MYKQRERYLCSVLHVENGAIMSSGHYGGHFLLFCELGFEFLIPHYTKPLFFDVK